MPGKILIVEPLPTTRIVLKVKLSTAFYTVSQAASLPEARARLKEDAPDLILLGADWGGADEGLALCRALKTAQPKGAPVPILMLSTRADRDMRKAALRAGADDLLAKPAHEAGLMARIRALIRARESLEGAHHLRDQATAALGFAEPDVAALRPETRMLLAAPDPATGVRWGALLKPVLPYRLTCEPIPRLLRALSQQPAPDAFVIALSSEAPEEGLRLLAELRARSATRNAAVLVILPPGGRSLYCDALDLGAGDVMSEGFDAEEVALRLERLLQRKRLADRLRKRVQDGLEAAVTDPLTGLFNRRYALPHMARAIENARRTGQDVAVMVADLDHFKSINDRYGHAAGDAVLSDVARRMRGCLRPGDLLARIGGEEFLVVMPATDRQSAHEMAARLCASLRRAPVHIQSRNLRIPVTVSIGLAMAGDFAAQDRADTHGAHDGAAVAVEALLDRADRALYGAKATGRDQVTLSPPAI